MIINIQCQALWKREVHTNLKKTRTLKTLLPNSEYNRNLECLALNTEINFINQESKCNVS